MGKVGMKHLLDHKTLLIQYLVPVAYTVIFYFLKVEPFDGSFWQVILILLGFYLGFALLWGDGKFLYALYNPTRPEPKRLITRSILFLIAYLALSVFIITSSGNILGVGMILGIGLQLALELVENRIDYDLFHTRFLFQIKRRFSPAEIMWVVWGFTACVILAAAYFLR